MSEEWRLLRGWNDRELQRLLLRARRLPRNFEGGRRRMDRHHGWNQVESRSLVAREAPGSPGPVYSALRRALERFEHSDPRIVRAHFDRADPLLDRTMLLELLALGVHLVAPVRVTAVRDAPFLFGYAIDTLSGHIETGREWFRLRKHPRTGDIRFHIDAAWGHGHFPGAWARLGFNLLGRRYQRAWHRLAHARLRRFASEVPVPGAPGPLHHSGSPLPLGPVQFYAVRGLRPAAAHIERERTERPDRPGSPDARGRSQGPGPG